MAWIRSINWCLLLTSSFWIGNRMCRELAWKRGGKGEWDNEFCGFHCHSTATNHLIPVTTFWNGCEFLIESFVLLSCSSSSSSPVAFWWHQCPKIMVGSLIWSNYEWRQSQSQSPSIVYHRTMALFAVTSCGVTTRFSTNALITIKWCLQQNTAKIAKILPQFQKISILSREKTHCNVVTSLLK